MAAGRAPGHCAVTILSLSLSLSAFVFCFSLLLRLVRCSYPPWGEEKNGNLRPTHTRRPRKKRSVVAATAVAVVWICALVFFLIFFLWLSMCEKAPRADHETLGSLLIFGSLLCFSSWFWLVRANERTVCSTTMSWRRPFSQLEPTTPPPPQQQPFQTRQNHLLRSGHRYRRRVPL